MIKRSISLPPAKLWTPIGEHEFCSKMSYFNKYSARYFGGARFL